MGKWILQGDDCARARQCVCGFCKREGMCDFRDCHRPAVFRMFGQGNGRPACSRCSRSALVKSLGYRVVGAL